MSTPRSAASVLRDLSARYLGATHKDRPKYNIGRRQDIRDLFDSSAIYLTRWWLIETPFFSVLLHKINRNDEDRHLHCHPFKFVSVKLLGGYVEEFCPSPGLAKADAIMLAMGNPIRVAEVRTMKAPSIHVVRLTDFHKVKRLLRVPTWTLLFIGGNEHDWGYMTENGYVDHEAYHHNRNPEEF